MFPASNSNLPENRYIMCRTKEEIDELPEDSCNMIDRYVDRLKAAFLGWKYKMLDTICFANFLVYYYILPTATMDTVNDSQPTIFQEDILSNNNNSCNYPVTIPLMSSTDKLKCRKVKAPLRYHVPNCHKYSEKYAHHVYVLSIS